MGDNRPTPKPFTNSKPVKMISKIKGGDYNY